jgi:hypothetical protein
MFGGSMGLTMSPFVLDGTAGFPKHLPMFNALSRSLTHSRLSIKRGTHRFPLRDSRDFFFLSQFLFGRENFHYEMANCASRFLAFYGRECREPFFRT